ncbi:MAG: DUF3365 domain-containing protein, partial [Desulfobacterales bacterium]|nr:DUF3365 domain-containing protein [Desulfobacterales bacterium]
MSYKNESKVTKIATKVILIVFAILLVSYSVTIFYQSSMLQKSYLSKEVDKSRTITTFCEQFRTFIGELRNSEAFNDNILLKELLEDIKAGKKYYETKMYKTVPVVAAWTAAKYKASELNYEFRVPKNDPRNQMNEPRPGVEKAVVD